MVAEKSSTNNEIVRAMKLALAMNHDFPLSILRHIRVTQRTRTYLFGTTSLLFG
jgi:hypothetical protein